MNDFTTKATESIVSDPVTGEIIDQKEIAERLLAQVREQGVNLVGPGGLGPFDGCVCCVSGVLVV